MKRPRPRPGFCKTHPTYQALRKPTADCADCRRAFQARQDARVVLKPGMDRLVILDAEGHPKYLVEGDDIAPHPQHVHVMRRNNVCIICLKTKYELEFPKEPA